MSPSQCDRAPAKPKNPGATSDGGGPPIRSEDGRRDRPATRSDADTRREFHRAGSPRPFRPRHRPELVRRWETSRPSALTPSFHPIESWIRPKSKVDSTNASAWLDKAYQTDPILPPLLFGKAFLSERDSRSDKVGHRVCRPPRGFQETPPPGGRRERKPRASPGMTGLPQKDRRESAASGRETDGAT